MAATDASRFTGALLLAAAFCAGNAAHAADRFGPVSPPGQQFMLYVSHPLGVGGHMRNVYGLKFERTSSAGIDASTRFAAPLRHRTLIDLQFAWRTTTRMQFGTRTTWDLGMRQLGPTSELVESPWRPGAMNAERSQPAPQS